VLGELRFDLEGGEGFDFWRLRLGDVLRVPVSRRRALLELNGRLALEVGGERVACRA
jgi:hypothetical protein